jgi:murein DD-endopeptidase MepM/ murein hydrolase activator NlpD
MNTIPDSRFTQYMVRENGLDRRGFQAWVFLRAMLFGAEDKWWGDRGRRAFPHEGLDFCLFSDASRSLFRLEEGTRIPAMYDGTVVAIIDDFLGASIVLEHRLPRHRDPFLTIYGHMAVRETLHVESAVREAEIIGTLAEPGTSPVRIHPHLHVSLARPSESASYNNLTWRDLNNPGLFTMIDPLAVMAGPYQVIERDEENPEPV